MNRNVSPVRIKWQTVLLVFAILAVTLLALTAPTAGILATIWTMRMEDHSFVTGDEHLVGYRFEADGVMYECLPLPEGVDSKMLKVEIDLTEYDRVVSGNIDYLVFDDPLETGDAVYLFVPIYSLGQDKEACVLYVKEATK